jgi:hypothetical protein
MYGEKFAVVKFRGRIKQVFAKDEDTLNKINYLHYIFKRNSENLIPESIVNKKDDDFGEDFDEFSERGQRE